MQVTCNKCGWVHFTVTKAYIEKWNKDWSRYCRMWPEERLELYGIKDRKPPSDSQYYKCFRCSNDYKDFRPAKEGDCPIGCTQQPILDFKE